MIQISESDKQKEGEDDDDGLKDDLKLSCAVIDCKSCEIAEDGDKLI